MRGSPPKLALVALLALLLEPLADAQGPKSPFGWLMKVLVEPVIHGIHVMFERVVEELKELPERWAKRYPPATSYERLKEGKHWWEEKRQKLARRWGFIAAYLALLGYVAYSTYLSLMYLKDDILRNPSLAEGTPLRELIGVTTQLIYPLLLLALTLLASYLLFLSASPQQRARAKLLFAKLLVAMVLVSLSPKLLGLLFLTSEKLTEVILAQGQKEADAAIGTYQKALGGAFLYILASYAGPEGLGMLVEWAAHKKAEAIKPPTERKRLEVWKVWEFPEHYGAMMEEFILIEEVEVPTLTRKRLELAKGFLEGLRIEGRPSVTTPGLALLMLLIIAIYGLLAFRLLILHFLAVIFPFTILAYFFEPLRRLGGTLLEQTLLWTLMQAFFALALVVVGLTKLIFLMAGEEEVLAPGILCIPFTDLCFFSLFDLTACFFLIIGSIMLFMLMKKLVPPH